MSRSVEDLAGMNAERGALQGHEAVQAAPAAARAPAVGTNLKLRLSLLITALVALITLAGGSYVVRKAREDTRLEVRSTMSLTGHFLDAQMEVLKDHWRGQGYAVPLFQLKNLREVRHLEVSFYDSRGQLLDSNEEGGERRPEAPAWFVWLVSAYSQPLEASHRTVSLDGATVGELVIRADPSYEIDEIWATSRGLLELLLLFFVLVNALVWWAVSRALRPVEYILGALGEIERGNLGARLPPFELPEMARIGVGFNHMAETLERSLRENRSLTRRLMQAQEEERTKLARELHDEIGQCVTAIHADAVAIRKSGGAPVRESAEAIVEATGRIKDMVRSILRRLRPGALEGVGLGAALRELVGGFRQRNPQLSCALRLAEEAAEVQGETGIALYRTVQECLTNVSRHAGAQTVEIELSRVQGAGGPDLLECSVRDDGRGFDERAGGGFGLLGIRERVKALGGSCAIEGRPGRGARVTVRLPLPVVEGT